MSDLDSLTALLLLPLARSADFLTACLRLGQALAEHGGYPLEVEFTDLSWSDPIHRAWLLAAVQEPGGYLVH